MRWICNRRRQKPHPRIVLGGGGKGLLRIAARHADVLNVIADVGRRGYISMRGAARLDDDRFRSKVDFVRAEAAGLGRDPRAIEISHFAFTLILADTSDAARSAREGMAGMLRTTPDAVAQSPMSLIGLPRR